MSYDRLHRSSDAWPAAGPLGAASSPGKRTLTSQFPQPPDPGPRSAAPSAGTPQAAGAEEAAALKLAVDTMKVAAARATITIEHGQEMAFQYVNPQLLRQFAYLRDNNPRERFRPLAALLQKRNALVRELTALPAELAEVRGEQAAVESQADAEADATARRKLQHRAERIEKAADKLSDRHELVKNQLARLEGKIAESSAQLRRSLLTYFESKLKDASRAEHQASAQDDRAEEALEAKQGQAAIAAVHALRIRLAIVETVIAIQGATTPADEAQRSELTAQLGRMLGELGEEQRATLPPPPAAGASKADLAQLRSALSPAMSRLSSLTRAEASAAKRHDVAEARSEAAVDRLEAVETIRSGLESEDLPITIILPRVDLVGMVAGSAESYTLRAALGGIATDNPEGFKEGGKHKITSATIRQITAEHFTDALAGDRVIAILKIIGKGEGGADSINTYETPKRATVGPGFTTDGYVQKALFLLHAADPESYERLFGQFGIEVAGTQRHPKMSVLLLPVRDDEERPRELPDSGRVSGDLAAMAIAADPVLLTVFRRAGSDPAWHRALTETMVAGSIKKAMNLTLAVPGGGEVRLLDVLHGVDEATITGVLACAAYKLHALPSSTAVRTTASTVYARVAADHDFDPRQPNHEPAMPLDARIAVARAVLDLVAEKKRQTFETAIPGLSFD